jgi:hypothetical protein
MWRWLSRGYLDAFVKDMNAQFGEVLNKLHAGYMAEATVHLREEKANRFTLDQDKKRRHEELIAAIKSLQKPSAQAFVPGGPGAQQQNQPPFYGNTSP